MSSFHSDIRNYMYFKMILMMKAHDNPSLWYLFIRLTKKLRLSNERGLGFPLPLKIETGTLLIRYIDKIHTYCIGEITLWILEPILLPIFYPYESIYFFQIFIYCNGDQAPFKLWFNGLKKVFWMKCFSCDLMALLPLISIIRIELMRNDCMKLLK